MGNRTLFHIFFGMYEFLLSGFLNVSRLFADKEENIGPKTVTINDSDVPYLTVYFCPHTFAMHSIHIKIYYSYKKKKSNSETTIVFKAKFSLPGRSFHSFRDLKVANRRF